MASLIVGGVTIPLAPGGIKRDRLDATDRARAFDQTYRASVTGNVKRDWFFSTPPIARLTADLYESVLGTVTAQDCSGDIPGSTTNLLLFPNEWDNAAWTKTGTTVGANTGLAPNGLVSADNLREDNSVGNHVVSQAVTAAVGVYYYSQWVKAVERNKVVIAMGDGATGNASVGVDLVTGGTFASGLAVGSWTGISSTITPAVDGWYGVTIKGTRGAGSATSAQTWMWLTSLSYTGVSPNSVNGWGAVLSTSALTCHSQITDWAPVRTSDGYRVVLSFSLHEA